MLNLRYCIIPSRLAPRPPLWSLFLLKNCNFTACLLQAFRTAPRRTTWPRSAASSSTQPESFTTRQRRQTTSYFSATKNLQYFHSPALTGTLKLVCVGEDDNKVVNFLTPPIIMSETIHSPQPANNILPIVGQVRYFRYFNSFIFHFDYFQ